MTRVRAFAAKLCGWVAGACVAAMMLLIVVDIVLRALASKPIPGVFEIVELLLACSFFLALPATFLRDEHIVVDMIDGMAPRQVPLLKRISAALGVVVLALMAWQGWIAAQDSLIFGDVTFDLSLSRIIYWIPVLAGMMVAALAALVMAASSDADRRKDDA